MIKAKYKNRIIFVSLSVFLLLIVEFVIISQEKHDWKKFQKEYYSEYRDRIDKKLSDAESRNDEKEVKKWIALKNELNRSSQVSIKQLYIPAAERRDLCQTCHMAMDNPLFIDDKNPLKVHPKDILAKHKINQFGCTLCHQGQGVALKTDKAHGYEHNWEKPRLPTQYTQASCFGCHENVAHLKGAEKASEGKKLFVENGCYGCHNANIIEDIPYPSTPLNGISKKVKNRNYIVKWIEDPGKTRPETQMPRFRLKENEIRDISSYVLSLKPSVNIEEGKYKKGVKALGEKTFTEKACIGCHSVKRDELGLKRRVPKLADAGVKLDKKWLYAWIDNPSSLNPDTKMPNVVLTDNEISDVATYLLSLKDKTVSERVNIKCEEGNVEEGKKLIQSLGCYGCHKIENLENQALVGVNVDEISKKRLEELPFGYSTVPKNKCDWLYNKIKQPDIYLTEDMPLKMPDFQLNESELEALTIFYINNRLYDISENLIVRNTDSIKTIEKGDWILDTYNCRGCHEIENNIKPRVDTFLSMKSMVPPRIVDEIARVKPQWLFQYISRPFEMRPWLKIRMPEFNLKYTDKKMLIDYFALTTNREEINTDIVPYVSEVVRSDYDDETIEMGKYRVVTDKCMQCHPVSMDGALPKDTKLEDLSINLMLSKSRLRYEWIINFMRDPDKFAGKGTKMPFVFYTPDGVPRIPKPEMWLNYTALYLMFMEKVPEMKVVEENAREEVQDDWSDY